MDFEIVSEDQAEKVMQDIKVCKPGIDIMLSKAKFRLLRINNVRTAVANILKQEILSAGGDAAVSINTVNCKDEQTDVLIMGTLTHYKILAHKMRSQGDIQISGCDEIADTIEKALLKV